MKRTITFLVLFMLATGVGDLLAQVPVHRNIGLDSLMAIMQKRTSEKIYYQSDESAKNLTFTVNEGSASLLDDIKKDNYGMESLNRTLVEFENFLNKYI